MRQLTIFIVCAGFASSVAAQSLAGVAEKENARRAGVSQPSKVITNDDLPPEAREAKPANGRRPAPPPGLGLSDGGQRLHVNSARGLIESKKWRANISGGQYAPTSGELSDDTVIVTCGDETIGQIFDCTKVKVTVNGANVQPLSYSAEPHTFTNGFGARWTVLKVTATYRGATLAGGFVVTYSSPSDIEWKFNVTGAQARETLFLQ